MRAGPGGQRQLRQCGCGSALVWGRVGWVGLLLDQRRARQKAATNADHKPQRRQRRRRLESPRFSDPQPLPGAPCVAIGGWRALQVRQSAVRAPLSPRCRSGRPLRLPEAGWRLPGAGGRRACLRAGRRGTRRKGFVFLSAWERWQTMVRCQGEMGWCLEGFST